MTTEDPGLAALAAVLHRATCGDGNEHWTDGRNEPSDIEMSAAAALLGECGVFLPEGIPDAWINARDLVDAEAEIARLRKIEAAVRAHRAERSHGVTANMTWADAQLDAALERSEP